ncbi:MAG: IclR family transcriptional regulator [bacterium]
MSSATAGKRTNGETKGKSSRTGIQVIERAAEVLRALNGETDGLSLGQIAKRVNLARSTVQRIVAALGNEKLLVPATPNGRVRLGPAIVQLAEGARADVVKTLNPFIESLSRKIGETVDLSILAGKRAVFVNQVIAPHRLQAVSAIGVSFPLHNTANGKAFLSAMDTTTAGKLVAEELGIETEKGRRCWESLSREVEEVRRSGIAYDREEHTEGICALGAVVGKEVGTLAAISIPMPAARFYGNEAMLSRELIRCCREIKENTGL